VDNSYTFVPDLTREINVPQNGILSRTLFNSDHLKVVIFGFDTEQELTAHTAPFQAALQIISGTATLQLGADTKEAGPGTWVHMAPHLEHGIKAKTPTVMLLLMLKQAR
jgi:quercetin dioxygenase-like cupin family protein